VVNKAIKIRMLRNISPQKDQISAKQSHITNYIDHIDHYL